MKGKLLIALLFVSLFGISACSSNKSSMSIEVPGTASQYGELLNAFMDQVSKIRITSEQQYSLPVTDIRIVLENTELKKIGHSECLFLEKRVGETLIKTILLLPISV